MAKKNLTQTQPMEQTAGVAAVSKKAAYYQKGEAMKEKSPAFKRYIGVMQKTYAGIPFWVLTVLVSVLAVLQVLDVYGTATVSPVYGLLQAIPLLFVVAAAVLMWRTVFHAKRKSDSYYPLKGMLSRILICFGLYLISAIAVSFVTSGFGSYMSLVMEEISTKSFATVMETVDAKFADALATGASIGKVDLSVGFSELNSAISSISDSKLETLGIGVIFGLIVMVIILLVRGFQILRVIAASRNSIEYEEKVSDAKITGKQYIIYGVIALVVALLVYLLDPMLSSMNFVSTGFNFIYESLASLKFADGSEAIFMLLTEVPEYQVILSVPMIMIALIGLVVFALFQIYRYIVLSGVFAKLNVSAKTGLVPNLRLTFVGVVSIVLSVLMLSNGITWCGAFFFSRVGGIALLTAIGKVVLIGISVLLVGMILLKNSNELKVCYMTQRRELGKEAVEKKKEFHWNLGKALIAVVGCVAVWLGAYWLMSTLDKAGNIVMQILPVMGGYDLSAFGGSLMNEILYTLIQLNDQAMLLFSNMNQLVLRAGLVVAAVVFMTSINRFYKSGFSPEATQKLSGGSLILPRILLYIFAVISGVLTVAQLLMEGAWAGELLAMITSVFDMAILLSLTTFFLRLAKCGKMWKILVPTVVGVVSQLVYTLLFELEYSFSYYLQDPMGRELFISLIITTLLFQLVRWLFATTYYLETNNLIPVVFFDFLLTMMMAIVASNISGFAVVAGAEKFLPVLMVELVKALFETMQNAGGVAMAELLPQIMPMLINLGVILLGVVSMLAIGLILLVRAIKASKLPGDELCDIDHVDDDGIFMTEAEILAQEEAKAAAKA